MSRRFPVVVLALVLTALPGWTPGRDGDSIKLDKDARIAMIGNGLGSRMIHFGHFETEMQLRYPDSLLFIRNMCDGGNTPGFRPHSGWTSRLRSD